MVRYWQREMQGQRPRSMRLHDMSMSTEPQSPRHGRRGGGSEAVVGDEAAKLTEVAGPRSGRALYARLRCFHYLLLAVESYRRRYIRIYMYI